MNDTPLTWPRFLWQYSVTVALIVGGFALADVVCDLVAPGNSVLYRLFLIPATLPFVLWLQYCEVIRRDPRLVIYVLAVLTVSTLLYVIAPANWNDHIIWRIGHIGVAIYLVAGAERVLRMIRPAKR